MIPIHELLNRIHWDKQFGTGDFEVGYYDRIENKIIRVPFHDIYMDKGDHYSFRAITPEGEIHSIPFHRIKEVYKDGQLIWHREH